MVTVSTYELERVLASSSAAHVETMLKILQQQLPHYRSSFHAHCCTVACMRLAYIEVKINKINYESVLARYAAYIT